MTMLFDGLSHQLPDIDPEETMEWMDSFDAVVDTKGRGRGRFLLMKMLERARTKQVDFPATISTPYVNTIAKDQEPWFPGDEQMERRIRAYIRWNAAVMVIRANTRNPGIGGHLSTYASSATLYEVGFNYFFRGKSDGGFGDQVFFQGHASPGIYARAFVEGRLSEEQMDSFRTEVDNGGLPSYPHPRLAPDFWEFPTVSMGLGPLFAIYQAHINRYLQSRELVDTSNARVWAFAGDGEMDEPEAIAALGVAGREHLDNLIFVVNCNLQRLDGPVRGNGKIIQELEATFRGAGWNVIKVIWGSKWDDLLARDVDGVLLDKMNTTPDGDFQKYATESGAYIREHFFGPDPRLRKMVEHLTDEELQNLPRGGHDYRKLYAAYKLATEEREAPTAILAKTIKGWMLGPEVEARNATHQIKKMGSAQLVALRDRLNLIEEIPDSALDGDIPPYYRPEKGSTAYDYIMARRKLTAGPVPQRVVRKRTTGKPDAKVFDDLLEGSNGQAVSTTMVFARLLRNMARDAEIGKLVVPIVPDEARTFGLEPLISEHKIYAPEGQLYTPVDAGLLLTYAEAKNGQILEEGITEAGAMAAFGSLATAYATWGRPMIPILLFYSMFGFQRAGDITWLLGDIRARGILAGCTAGRTTLEGEGLQHDDGHSPLLASVNPACRIYDPAFSYEIAAIMQYAVKEILDPDSEDAFFYLTLYNENYPMQALPPGIDRDRILEGTVKGMYLYAERPDGVSRATDRKDSQDSRDSRDSRDSATSGNGPAGKVPSSHESNGLSATLLFSGPLFGEVMKARELLASDWGIGADVYSATSYTTLRREALSTMRHNMLHPTIAPRLPYVTQMLSGGTGPIVAVSDYIRSVPDQIARFVPAGRMFMSLGTDGFGRSDTRSALRRFFETDAAHIVVATLYALALAGEIGPETVAAAIRRYSIDPELPDPWALK